MPSLSLCLVEELLMKYNKDGCLFTIVTKNHFDKYLAEVDRIMKEKGGKIENPGQYVTNLISKRLINQH